MMNHRGKGRGASRVFKGGGEKGGHRTFSSSHKGKGGEGVPGSRRREWSFRLGKKRGQIKKKKMGEIFTPTVRKKRGIHLLLGGKNGSFFAEKKGGLPGLAAEEKVADFLFLWQNAQGSRASSSHKKLPGRKKKGSCCPPHRKEEGSCRRRRISQRGEDWEPELRGRGKEKGVSGSPYMLTYGKRKKREGGALLVEREGGETN